MGHAATIQRCKDVRNMFDGPPHARLQQFLMALLLECQQYDFLPLHSDRPQNKPTIDYSLSADFTRLARQLEPIELLRPLRPVEAGGRMRGCLVQHLPMRLGVVYLVEVDCEAGRAAVTGRVLFEGRDLRVRSSELVANVSRTVRWVNGLESRGAAAGVVGRGGTIRVGLHVNIVYNCAQTIFAHLKLCIRQTTSFIRSFAPVILHAANLAPRTILHALPTPLKPVFFSSAGELGRLGEVIEFLTCVQCRLEDQEQLNVDRNANPKRIIRLAYRQSDIRGQIQLFAEPALYRPDSPLANFTKQALGLGYPSPRESPYDYPYIFNTITVTNFHRDGERVVAEGGRAKMVASATKFFYTKSHNPHEATKSKGQRSTAGTEQAVQEEAPLGVGCELQKMLLVKMPRVGPKDKQWRKMVEHIKYEKAILCNLRTVGCAYLPKYYHSLQKAYDHHPFLLMDFILGNTLSEELTYRSNTITLSTKLHLLSHLSNALRFLQEREIVHLDLTPSNVIVSRDLLTKVIDFGEAYHRTTSGRFAYSPGRTFPYAPPETSLRVAGFTSQQDMYSLGVILYQVIFGNLPFTCHQETHQKLYQQQDHHSRMLLAPQRGEQYGQRQVMAVLTNLAISLMEAEGGRPKPVWVHLIAKKLFYALR